MECAVHFVSYTGPDNYAIPDVVHPDAARRGVAWHRRLFHRVQRRH